MRLNKLSFWLQTGDTFLCCFVFFPLMVCYWRGIWDLVGVYLNPDEKVENDWMIFGIGSCSVFGYFLLPVLRRHLDRDKRVPYVIVTRVYMYFQAALYMCYWRGVWVLGDYYIYKLETALVSAFICLVILISMRALRMVIFSPMCAPLDTRPDLLDATPRFGTHTDQTLWYILDSLFSHFFITTAAVLAWQGLWIIYSHFLFPEDELKSDVASLVIGYTFCILLLSIESPLRKVSIYLGEKRWIYKLIWEDLIYLIVYGSIIFLWRGGWNLNDAYMISDNLVGGWVNHVVGTAGLMAVQLFSYVSFSGVVMDGADPLGEAFFANKYLRVYVSQHVEQKEYEVTTLSNSLPSNETGQDNVAFSSDSYAYPDSFTLSTDSVDVSVVIALTMRQ